MMLVMALAGASPADDWHNALHAERASPGDLEVAGAMGGTLAGETRYLRYEDLFRLPQETYEVSDDSNFRAKTQISGVALKTLAEALGKPTDMIVAIWKVHLHHGFFNQNGGYEFPLTLATVAFALIFLGAGELSIDALLGRGGGGKK